MLSAPADLTSAEIRTALAHGWGLAAVAATYLPVGFGSHHWSVIDEAGEQWFATADVADEHLEPALRTAAALRAAGLEFVIASTPTTGGTASYPAGSRYLLSLFPFVDGKSGDFGPHRPADIGPVKALLERLHAATVEAEPLQIAVPGLAGLQRARMTTGDGPYGEAARALLTAKSGTINALLADYGRLAAGLPSTDRWVVTHGEPHPGNFLRTSTGLKLVDWDTVRRAPAERDLWLVEDEPGAPVFDFFRLRWRLADIAASAADLSIPHADTEDTSAIFGYLRAYLE